MEQVIYGAHRIINRQTFSILDSTNIALAYRRSRIAYFEAGFYVYPIVEL